MPKDAGSAIGMEAVLRWTARLAGSGLAGAWLLFGVTAALFDTEPFTFE